MQASLAVSLTYLRDLEVSELEEERYAYGLELLLFFFANATQAQISKVERNPNQIQFKISGG